MNSDVNLASVRNDRKEYNKYLKYSIAFFSISFFASLGLIIYVILMNFRLQQLSESEEELITQIKSKQSVEVNYTKMVNRARNVHAILQGRTPIDGRIESFFELVPGSVSIERLEVESNRFRVRVRSRTLVELDRFVNENINNFIQEDGRVIKADIASFGIDSLSSEYYTTVLIEYKT